MSGNLHKEVSAIVRAVFCGGVFFDLQFALFQLGAGYSEVSESINVTVAPLPVTLSTLIVASS